MALFPPYKFASAGVGISQIYCRELGYFKTGKRKAEVDKIAFKQMEVQERFNREKLTDAIFQLEYSKDGRVLGAACSNKMYLLFDTSTQKLIEAKEHAHFDCCNGITFIDDNLYATYSDDKTIKVWDLRKRDNCVKTLLGHNSYVKNVEVLDEKTLITSAYDDPLRIYDLNAPAAKVLGKPLMAFPKVMRISLSPVTKSFMIITTRGGLVYRLSDIDINTLQDDMDTFNEEALRVQSLSQLNIERKMLRKYTNKLTFVHLPQTYSNSSMASSVSIHPEECCVFVRHESNLHFDARRSWSSVYAFTDAPLQARFDMRPYGLDVEPVKVLPLPGAWTSLRKRRKRFHETEDTVNDADNENSEDSDRQPVSSSSSSSEDSGNTSASEESWEVRGEGDMKNYYLLSALTHVMSKGQKQPAVTSSFRNILPLMVKRGLNFTQLLLKERGPSKTDQYDASFNITEARNDLGLIQGNCFHPSGNFMVSPHLNGFRVLAFDEHGSSFQSTFDPDIFQFHSQRLHEVFEFSEELGFQSAVLTVKCHPSRPQMVTGCLRGNINFHQTQF